MIRILMTIAILVVMMGIFSESGGKHGISFETGVYGDVMKADYGPLGKPSAEFSRLGFSRYLVQRQSTQPPSGSYSGRASGSAPGGRAGSMRDSSGQSDLAQGDSTGDIINEALKGTRHSQKATKKKHDPTKGGGRSPAGFDRRGGAR